MARHCSNPASGGNATRARILARGAALALAAVLAPLAAARAQPPGDNGAVLVAPAPPPTAPAPKPDAVPLDQYTARMIGARRLKLGILAFDYGVTDRFSFGTDPPEWALRAVRSVLVPNLHVKGLIAHTPNVDVSVQLAGYYANIGTSVADGELFVVPATVFVSTKLSSKLWLHLEGAYNWSRAFGSGDLTRAEIGGTAVMRTAQLGAMAEVRLSRVVALIARMRYQFYSTPIIMQGSGTLDPYTQASASFEVQPRVAHPAMGIGGVALTWKYVGLVAGAGYGHYFLPGANLAVPYNGIVPEGSLWVLF